MQDHHGDGSEFNLGSTEEQLPLLGNLDRLNLQGIASFLKRLIPFSEGKRIHEHVVKTGLDREPYVGNLLICMYRRCGALEDARSVFNSMPNPNVVSWTAIIAAYSERQLHNEAFLLFRQMQEQDVDPNQVTFIIILGVCAGSRSLGEGKAIHIRIIEYGLGSHLAVATALVSMYGKCGALEEAKVVFDKMHGRNVISWTAIIAAFAEYGNGKKALELFAHMQQEGVNPNSVTFVTILDVCGNIETLEQGKALHARIVDAGFESDLIVGTALLHMYGKYKDVENARLVFERMNYHDVISWNAIIMVYSEHADGKEAFQLFELMRQECVEANESTFVSVLNVCNHPTHIVMGSTIHAFIVKAGFQSDAVVGTALVQMYGMCEALEKAHLAFTKICQHDVDSWNAIIIVYSRHGHFEKAFKHFQQMQQEKVEPNEETFTHMLEACVSPASLAIGRVIHRSIVDYGFQSDVTGTALLGMYSKCGALKDAHFVFDHLQHADAVAWTAMIAAYSQHGQGHEALTMFKVMQQKGVQPDIVTFVCLLSACSHAGLVEEGRYIFYLMIEDYFILPRLEHYCSLIDLLGRAGKLDEAEETISTMPFQPDTAVWLALLGACNLHGDVKRGKRIADQLFALEPQNAAAHTLLSNMYAREGRWEQLEEVTDALAETG